MPFYYMDWTYLLIIPGLILGLWAQHQVNSAYRRYGQVQTRLGRTACEVAQDLLRRNGNSVVRVGRVHGQLTDHYDPAKEELNLCLNSASSPCIITAADGSKNFTYMILPVRLHA